MINAKVISERFVERIEEMRSNPERYRGYPTGIDDLDKIIGGILPGRYYVIGGKQKSGKTAFVLTLLLNMSRYGIKTLYISLEMGLFEIAQRLFANVSGVTLSQFRDLEITDEDIAKIKEAAAVIANLDAWFDYGVAEIDRILDAANRIKPHVLIVDYFQLIDAHGSNRREALTEVSRRFKQFANSTGISVIVPSQVGRQSIRSGMLDANAFMETSALEQDADVAMIVDDYRNPYTNVIDTTKRTIRIVASRISQTAEINVYFNGARSLMSSQLPNLNNGRL